jgi:hypothetical protein
MEKEPLKIIEDLKNRIIDGWAMANDPLCSDGFKAADMLIKFYEEQLQLYKTVSKND